MNKRQLAAKIWKGANNLRGKISAAAYKDYMLGFMFYKYLSDKEENTLRDNFYDEEDIQKLTEEGTDSVEFCKVNLGYFMSYDNLFSTWVKKIKSANVEEDLKIKDVREALSAFDRLIDNRYKKIFSGIFNTLETGLNELGSQDNERTKAVKGLVKLIDEIPMNKKQDYDVLGFVYEFLLKNFAANAGKAGEFYTPYEASFLMSEIIADHTKDRENIKIYDPTSGSGSLLINIGKAITKHLTNKNGVEYYAQELIPNTYNLTRMNLVMRDILPNNIVVRCGDTLSDDWPFFVEGDREHTYDPVFVDACISNPPYSQSWSPKTDARFSEYGLAPKGKADLAFLLHNLYHLKDDGIMAIVMPHGVLFRGGDEGIIRKKLVEKDNIETVIGLPHNMFFGTGIPTIIMILKKQRTSNDILFVDASKGFAKDGNKNRLSAKDVRRIVDAVIQRNTIDKYSRVVSKQVIRDNEYNLNIPRYVDSTDKAENWDIYATMFGGIPNYEIDELNEYWRVFPSLRNELFENLDIPYSNVKVEDIKSAIESNVDVKKFIEDYIKAFQNLPVYLKENLIEQMETLNIGKEEIVLAEDIQSRLNGLPLIDYYDAYQMLDDDWQIKSVDLELIQSEGKEVIKQVDKNMVSKGDADEEFQDGWVGHILPFELVQEECFKDELASIKAKEDRLSEIASEYQSIIDGFEDEDKESLSKNSDDESDSAREIVIDTKKIEAKAKECYAEIKDGGIGELFAYLVITGKKEKIAFIAEHKNIDWENIVSSKDGTYSKSNVNKYISVLYDAYKFPDDTFEGNVVKANKLINEEKILKKEVKTEKAELHEKTKNFIEGLSIDDAVALLEIKWARPICESLNTLPDAVIDALVLRIKAQKEKYEITYEAVSDHIEASEKSLCEMISELGGGEFDMKGLAEFKKLIGGNEDE